MSRPTRAVLATACLATLAGCTSTAPSNGTITVTATETACELSTTEAKAGTVTFSITNKGTSVNEFYFYGPGDRIVGEVENIGPGLSRSLVVEVPDGGAYTSACKPGMAGDGIRAPFTVKGAATAQTAADPKLAAAVRDYREYVEGEAKSLVTRVTTFAEAVKAGDVPQAKALYPAARTPWERIEPVAESFGDIDPKVDGREDDERDPGVLFTGFHRLEKDLWVSGLQADSGAMAERLVADVKDLADRVGQVPLAPVQMANGAKELLDEVATTKVTGEEDRYSHTDLWDFAANVEGSKKALATMRPALDAKNPELRRQLDTRFAAVDALLAKYRAGNGYRLYTELTPVDVKAMTEAVDALSEPVSQVAGVVTA